jgi:hypothetical protein
MNFNTELLKRQALLWSVMSRLQIAGAVSLRSVIKLAHTPLTNILVSFFQRMWYDNSGVKYEAIFWPFFDRFTTALFFTKRRGRRRVMFL